MSAFALLISPGPLAVYPFADLQNAPLPRIQPEGRMHPQFRCMALAPLHFRRKDPYLDQ